MDQSVSVRTVVEGIVVCECGGFMHEVEGRDVDTDMRLTFWRCENDHVTKPVPAAWLERLRRGKICG